ncbi:MAG: hypothetical protein K0R48_357 [Gammaproteobacteria bacterium]|nr:hypothetical protein [Gammaproteobacteria bacterium]
MPVSWQIVYYYHRGEEVFHGRGKKSLAEASTVRREYIKSLQEADKGNYNLLFEVVRS